MTILDQVSRSQLDAVINRFDSGDNSSDLYTDFVALIDADLGEANYFLGCLHEDGTNGVAKNLEHALFYYQKSIDTVGYLEGYLAVARMRYHGDGIGVDYELAFRYFTHVAEHNRHLVAAFMLGKMYQYGQGVPLDRLIARRWFEDAIEQGSVYGLVNLANLEAFEGRWFKSKFLRCWAGLRATLLAWRNPKDMRLRGG